MLEKTIKSENMGEVVYFTNEPLVKFAKCRKDAIIPTKTKGNAGFDIYITADDDGRRKYVIPAHSTMLLPTGLKSIINENYYVQIQERGSTGSKGIKYSAGVIDSNYRGEWFLAVTNTNNKTLVICETEDLQKYTDVCYIAYDINKALFQGILHKIEDYSIMEVPLEEIENAKTDRGEGKLGSSGK